MINEVLLIFLYAHFWTELFLFGYNILFASELKVSRIMYFVLAVGKKIVRSVILFTKNYENTNFSIFKKSECC